jgi:protein ImuB
MQIACLDAPAFPLQLLQRAHPEWQGQPVVVVDEDRPQGRVLWANAEAFRCRVLPGTRYAAGLSLTDALRAGVISAEARAAGVEGLLAHLRRFSPNVEAMAERPGTFFLDAAGLDRLYGSLEVWGAQLLATLAEQGFEATLAVGFSRFGAFAGARGLQAEGGAALRRFADPAEEHAVARAVPLERLDFDPALRESLHRLGVRTVGAFLALPAAGLQTRFGEAAAALHRWARGDRFDPLRPTAAPPALWRRLLCEHPETDAHRLLFLGKRLLDPLLARLADRHEALAELHLVLTLDHGEPPRQVHALRPAEATLDAPLLLELLRLRLENTALAAGVTELFLSVRGVRADPEQIRLFQETPRRDLAAANRALSRIRAELGAEAVRRVGLKAGHLPEAGFEWLPLDALSPAEPRVQPRPRVVRRLMARPVRLPPVPRHLRNDGWIPLDPAAGAVVRLDGPYVVSGGWWHAEQHREYHFAHTRRGDVLWVYYDRVQRRWALQGLVE